MYGRMVAKLPSKDQNQYQKKTVEKYTDTELRNKLCGAGCINCEVLDMCRIGKEWIKRQKEDKK